MAPQIVDVWQQNFEKEIENIDRLMNAYNIVSIDSEFPGFFKNAPRRASDKQRYDALKFNVDHTRMIQLGLSLSDESGEVHSAWQFNLRFMLDVDKYSVESIQFLKQHGMDFDKLKANGIDPVRFGILFKRLVLSRRNLTWVTFHGLYDFAHLLGLMGLKPLPETMEEFAGALGKVLGSVADVKHMALLCDGLRGGELGLETLARILGVSRVGGKHQAGSDSLLTASVFAELNNIFGSQKTDYVGFLYGINVRVRRPSPPAYAPGFRPRHPYIQYPTFPSPAVYNPHLCVPVMYYA